IEGVKNLPDYIQIWPGHGAGSPCGKALGAIPMSTLGYEKINNWAFNVTDESKFVETITSNQPAPPHHFAQMNYNNQSDLKIYHPDKCYYKIDNRRIAFDLRS